MARKRLFSFFLPGGLILLAAVAFRHWIASPETFASLLRVLPYAVFGGGLFLGWRFHRSRLVFALLILVLADRILLSGGGGSAGGSGSTRLLFHAISLLLPLNLAVLSWMSERGLLPSRGILRWAFFLFQVSLVAWVYRYPTGGVGAALTQLFVQRGSAETCSLGPLYVPPMYYPVLQCMSNPGMADRWTRGNGARGRARVAMPDSIQPEQLPGTASADPASRKAGRNESWTSCLSASM